MLTPIDIIQRNLSVGCPVVSKVPMRRPGVFVRVDMAAPRRINLIQYRVQIIIQVYGDELEEVLDTMWRVQSQLEVLDVVDPVVCGWDEITGPVEFADPDIAQHRWQMTGELLFVVD